ncbi:MAG: N-acetyltransferase, partial [Halalkalicoccus sp.]
ASTDFHESMGFEPVGTYRGVGYKRGAWRDVRWCEKRLCDPPADPKSPIQFPDLGAATVERALETGQSLLR